jgi:hypothetical protein
MAFILSAISAYKEISLDVLTPAGIAISYNVTTGPVLIFTTLQFIPNS